ncbi:MAG: hypothetical protein KatS3mg087_0233 [Patescibacteria group bacterium]|nr:MAG: hypothetical protein KatS3mg087_0233 [Patescibacteria group bacterium]
MAIHKILLNTLITFTLLTPSTAFAQGLPNDIRSAFGSVDPEARLDAPETEQEVYEFVPVIYGAMLFVGLIAVLAYLLYAGILWITSGGDPKALAAARQTALNAVIGIIILATAYIIGLVFQRTVI